MLRYRICFVVLMLALAGAAAAAPAGQTGQAAAAAKAKYVPPVRGDAQVGYTPPMTRRVGDKVISTMMVKNLSKGRIAGLKIDESWYDAKQQAVTGGTYRHQKPLEIGEIITVTIETPFNPEMKQNMYTFSHAFGKIPKPRRMTLKELKAAKE